MGGKEDPRLLKLLSEKAKLESTYGKLKQKLNEGNDDQVNDFLDQIEKSTESLNKRISVLGLKTKTSD